MMAHNQKKTKMDSSGNENKKQDKRQKMSSNLKETEIKEDTTREQESVSTEDFGDGPTKLMEDSTKKLKGNHSKSVSTEPKPSTSASSLNTSRNNLKNLTFDNKESMNAFVSGLSNTFINPFDNKTQSVKFMVTRDTLQAEEILSKEQITLKIPEKTDNFEAHVAYFNNYKKYCTIMQAQSLKFWNDVAEFLALLGEHVWEMTIAQEDCGLTPAYLLEILALCLQHTPNLKKLVVDGSFSEILLKPEIGSRGDYEHMIYVSVPAKHLTEMHSNLGRIFRGTDISAASQRRIKMVEKLWWHPLLLKRMNEAKEFLERASLPKLPQLKTIKLDLEEYLPNYMNGISTQGYSICNYVYLKNEEILSSAFWSKFPALKNVSIEFEKLRVCGNAFKPFVRRWMRNDGKKFGERDLRLNLNPMPSSSSSGWSSEYVYSFEKPEVTTDREYIEENLFLYIPGPFRCKICDKSRFSGEAELKAHRQTHPTEDPDPISPEEYAMMRSERQLRSRTK